MKITKRQLRRIIREEKQRILREQIRGIEEFQPGPIVGPIVNEIEGYVGEQLMLWWENNSEQTDYPMDGEDEYGNSSRDGWEGEVEMAMDRTFRLELEQAIRGAFVNLEKRMGIQGVLI